jgi:hypothetical protein
MTSFFLCIILLTVGPSSLFGTQDTVLQAEENLQGWFLARRYDLRAICERIGTLDHMELWHNKGVIVINDGFLGKRVYVVRIPSKSRSALTFLIVRAFVAATEKYNRNVHYGSVYMIYNLNDNCS